MEALRESARSVAASNEGSPEQGGRSRATSGSSEWTSTYGGGESTASGESEGRPEEAWLRRMLTGAQMPTTAMENGQESVMNDLEALEHGLKMICFSKITESIEAANRARAAMEQMMRIQSKEREQNRQRMLILEQYKDISQKLSMENSLLKEQIASWKGGKVNSTLPSPTPATRSTMNITEDDSADGAEENEVGGDVHDAKGEALREIEEENLTMRPLVID